MNFPKRILKLSSEREHIHQFITFFLHKIHHPITLTPFVLKLFKRIKERFALTPQSTQAKHIISPSIYPLVKQLIPIIGLSYTFSRQVMVKFSKTNATTLVWDKISHIHHHNKVKKFICALIIDKQTKNLFTILKKFHMIITSLLP